GRERHVVWSLETADQADREVLAGRGDELGVADAVDGGLGLDLELAAGVGRRRRLVEQRRRIGGHRGRGLYFDGVHVERPVRKRLARGRGVEQRVGDRDQEFLARECDRVRGRELARIVERRNRARGDALARRP